MKMIAAFALAALGAAGLTACSQDVQAMDAKQIEQKYGVTGAFASTIVTPGGAMTGTLVPITLANGRQAQLFIPQRQASDVQAVYIRDDQGLHPVELSDHASRAEVTRTPRIVETRAAPRTSKRSWEKEVLIVGGSAGAGTTIGALAGGKKGAGVGAAVGGVGGLIYDLTTRTKK
jgi:hypothetical protein